MMPTKTSAGPNEVVRLGVLRLTPRNMTRVARRRKNGQHTTRVLHYVGPDGLFVEPLFCDLAYAPPQPCL
jgi:hypothetical protein